MNAEARAEYIVNSLRDSIPLIAEEIRIVQREMVEKCLMILRKHWVPLKIREEIRALIEELGEE